LLPDEPFYQVKQFIQKEEDGYTIEKIAYADGYPAKQGPLDRGGHSIQSMRIIALYCIREKGE
jgi:hypothetical protein